LPPYAEAMVVEATRTLENVTAELLLAVGPRWNESAGDTKLDGLPDLFRASVADPPGVGTGRASEYFVFRLRNALARLLVLWWVLVERSYRASLPALRAFLTPDEVLTAVAAVCANRAGVHRRRVTLAYPPVRMKEKREHGGH
jgi:hypothetical protein